MKKTNLFLFSSVSYSIKSLITGCFLLVFLALANHGSAQLAPPTLESVLPPLRSKIQCTEIANKESALLLAELKTYPDPPPNPNDPKLVSLRKLFNGYEFIIQEVNVPGYDMPTILALLYPQMHGGSDGTATNSYGFYAKSWNKEYTEIINKFKN